MDLGELSGICAECTSDYDCPGSKKCCRSSIGSCVTYCVLPDTGSSSILNSRISGTGGINTVTTRRIIETKTVSQHGLDSGISGGSGIDGIIGGSRQRVDTVDLRGHSGIGGIDTVSGISGKRIVETGTGSGHGIGNDIGGSVGGSRRIIETVDLGGKSGFGTKKILGGKTVSHVSTSRSGSTFSGSSLGHLSSDGGCHVDCGIGKPCAVGYTCIQSGCHRTCEVVGGGALVGQSTILETIGARRVDLLDALSGQSSGSARGSGLFGASETVVGGGCRKQCHADSDCTLNEYCVTIGCNMVCRRSKEVKNDYRP